MSDVWLDARGDGHRRQDDLCLRPGDVNERGEVVGRGDLRAQSGTPSRTCGWRWPPWAPLSRDVVKTNLYVVGLKSEHVPIIREIRGQFVRADHPRVSTLVGISALVGPDWLIEIEAVAVRPE